MKTPSEELHSLIHSLSQNEKRYFVLFTRNLGGSKREKKYLDLFHFIDRSAEYNEQKAKARIGGISPSAFKKLKHYTFALILKSLENFHSNSSDDITITRYLQQSDILFQKKQLGPALKMADRALTIAIDKDRILLTLPCYEWKLNIALASAKPKEGLKGVEEKQIKKYVADAGRWLSIRRSILYFWEIIHHKSVIGVAEKKILNRIIRDTLKLYRVAPSGYTITKETCSSLALCYRFTGNWNESYAWRKKLVKLLESRKSLLNENAPEYVVSLGNLMNACREMKRMSETVSTFRKVNAFMEKLPKRYFELRLDERFCNVLNGYVSFLYASGKYFGAAKHGEELMLRIKKHSGVFQNSLIAVLFDNIMFSYYHMKDLRMCRRYYQQWMRHSSRDELSKRLFGIILCYDLNDLDLLSYQARAFHYHVKKDRKAGRHLKLLANFFQNDIASSGNKHSEKEHFRSIYKKLIKYKERINTETGIDVTGWLLDKA